MQHHIQEGELDFAEDVRSHCKNFPSGLPCKDKRAKEGCDRGSEAGIVYSERDGEGPVPLRKPKESDTVYKPIHNCNIVQPGSQKICTERFTELQS